MRFLNNRGVAAVEFAIIAPVTLAMLLPIADIGIAAMRYISARQSLRDLAAYALLNPPPDLSVNLTSYYTGKISQWPTGTTVTACGETVCTNAPAAPTSLVFTTTITLQPIVFDVGCRTGCTVNYLLPLN